MKNRSIVVIHRILYSKGILLLTRFCNLPIGVEVSVGRICCAALFLLMSFFVIATSLFCVHYKVRGIIEMFVSDKRSIMDFAQSTSGKNDTHSSPSSLTSLGWVPSIHCHKAE